MAIFNALKRSYLVLMSYYISEANIIDLRNDGWNVLFNNISVISGWRVGDNERLCAMESCLQLKRSSPRRLNPGPLDQQAST